MYRIKFSDPRDPLRVPWDIVVADSEESKILRVQGKHPYEGYNLLGFERVPFECELTVPFDHTWPTDSVGMHPVFVRTGGGIFTCTGLVVEEVIEEGAGDAV